MKGKDITFQKVKNISTYCKCCKKKIEYNNWEIKPYVVGCLRNSICTGCKIARLESDLALVKKLNKFEKIKEKYEE